MTSFANAVAPLLVLTAPMLYLAIGLLPTKWANAFPKSIARYNSMVAWLAMTVAVLSGFLYLFGSPRSWSLFSLDLPGGIGAFSLSTYINSVTVIMLLLVSFVGVIVSRYARSYLEGETRQGQFHKWLSLTLASILTLIISGNLLMFSLAWIATSLCLHQLLMFYRERPAAVLAAHKKFVASRIGDVSLIIAIFIIGATLQTLEFDEIFNILKDSPEPIPNALHWAAVLIVISAALKSAQFPFHGWLIQVMEAPTPVSALLHAGIVNAGAFLVIRMSPVVSQSNTALTLLTMIGLTTLALASLVMLTQTSVKVSLAWSTTAQMGFMLLETGLGLYSLAMLHLVAHSLYKAHAFLSSGSSADVFRGPDMNLQSSVQPFWRWSFAVSSGVLMTLGIGLTFGITPEEQPALLAASVIVAIAITQLLLQATHLSNNFSFLLRALGIAAVAGIAYFTLHHGFERAIEESVIPVKSFTGTLPMVLITLTVLVFIGLLLMQHYLKTSRMSFNQSIYVHLYNGLYIDVYISRVLERLWPAPDKLYGGMK